MKFIVRKSRISIIDGAIVVWLVCWSGFDFIRAWRRHSPYTVGEGIFFALAIVLILITPFELKHRSAFPEKQTGQNAEKPSEFPTNE